MFEFQSECLHEYEEVLSDQIHILKVKDKEINNYMNNVTSCHVY